MTEVSEASAQPKPGKLAQVAGAALLGVMLWGVVKVGGWVFSGPAKAEKVEDLSRHIVKVETTNVSGQGERLIITHFQKDILSEKTFVSGLSFDAVRINKGIVENWPDKYFEVLYLFKVPTTDKFGQSGDALALKVKWDVADLKKVNWDNFTAWGMLNITSDVHFKPIGRQAATEYCRDDDNLKYAINFCSHLIQ